MILTVKGKLLRKTRADMNWVDLSPLLRANQEASHLSIEGLIKSPSSPETVFIHGSGPTSWTTTDCGLHIQPINHREALSRWLFNPSKPTCALGFFLADPPCKPSETGCVQHYVLKVTTDLGKSWQSVEKSVRDAQWYLKV
jgi:hypothetical protein